MECAVLNTTKIGDHLQVRVHSLYLGAQLKSLVHGLFSQLKSLEISAEQFLVTVLPRIGGQTT